MKYFTITPLVWLQSDTNENWWIAQGRGSYQVEHISGSGWQWRYCWGEYYDEDYHYCDSFEEAKSAAEAHYRERVMEFLTEVQPPTDQPKADGGA